MVPDITIKQDDSPFDPGQPGAYARWRAWKLAQAPADAAALVVEIADPFAITPAERERLQALLARCNTAVYQCEPDAGDQRAIAQALVRQLGMERLDGHLCAEDDGLSSIQVMPAGTRHEGYIPYSDRPISWHTDGYYNRPDRQIHSMLLHCAQDALEGGENCILDHEIVYIQLRDENPDYIRALMRPDAMRIPANVENGVEIRPAVDGPVFSVSADGALHMRYTARTRSIEWHPDPVVQAAAERLRSLLSDDNPYVLRLRLRPGQGILSNNVLHNRTRFTDSEDGSRKRLVYRARCHDRIDNISSHRACLG